MQNKVYAFGGYPKLLADVWDARYGVVFFRRVEAVNGSVMGDTERMVGKEVVAVVDQGLFARRFPASRIESEGGVSGGMGIDLMVGRQ
jgi:hypothetical protein